MVIQSTPGPWHQDGLTIYAHGPRGLQRMAIKVTPGPLVASPHSDMGAMSEQISNARLIAMLPDLLAENRKLRAENGRLRNQVRETA